MKKRFCMVEYLLESKTLKQIYFVEAENESEARHMIDHYGTMLVIIPCDEVKTPYRFFMTSEDHMTFNQFLEKQKKGELTL